MYLEFLPPSFAEVFRISYLHVPSFSGRVNYFLDLEQFLEAWGCQALI